MAQIIKLKRSTTAGSAPTTSDLAVGELAINVHDGKVFLRRSGSVAGDTIETLLSNEYTGSVDVQGDVTATNFIGNGSQLSNLTIAQTATVRQAYVGTTWSVVHNLDTLNPIVQAYDGNSFQIIPQTSRITDENTVTLTFPTSVSGSAVVAKGGHIVSGSIGASNINGFPERVVTSLNAEGVISGSLQVTLAGDVTGTAAATVIAEVDGGDI